ncbi:MAG: DUF58 domain-containing protein [Proteobacteria bacterium]|nr:DUF58 domain-containing protein [Pseudomonadota bacterium]
MKRRSPASRSNKSLLKLRRRIFPRGLTFTREGKVYVVVTLGVGFAAVNTGNNLLFLVLGLMLGLIIVSGILSEVTLRGIDVRRQVPNRMEAGAPFAVELTLQNKKRWAASFGVELRDEIDGKPFRRRCFFLRVGKGEDRAVAYRCELMKRGRSTFNGTIVSTRFPFGFFEKRRFMELKDEVIVLPARVDVFVPLPFVKEGSGASSATLPGPGQEFRELRDMVPGDDPRRIHWRSTARIGHPLVRETDAEARGFVEIVLDPAPNGSSDAALEQVEQNIRAAGTVVRDLTRQGVTTRLVTTERQSLEACDRNGAIQMLVHLALLDTEAAKSANAPMGENAAAVIIGPRARSSGRAYRLLVPPSQSDRARVGT